ncbi:MAG: A/G-specific adenine glycosylase [Acidobacteria bacterium]|nr:A/G-specific adenine glycosylase [Acidobacteriota bacterium]
MRRCRPPPATHNRSVGWYARDSGSGSSTRVGKTTKLTSWLTADSNNPASPRHFRRAVLEWYDRQRRDLPWRAHRDPYRIWVSEIMLQQTRVPVVGSYYDYFLKRFPTVEKLARARLDSVLAAWSGLGYYRRARCLHAAAKKIIKHGNRDFPVAADDWRKLPGVGRYTAAAVASIAFRQPVAAVDGNVERVLSRLVGNRLSGERSWRLAQTLLSVARPGDFNQAMMDLGATVCLPRAPACGLCPVRNLCATRGELGGRRIRRRQKLEVSYVLKVRGGSVLLTRRPPTSTLMAGMWELPEIQPDTGERKGWLRLQHSITRTDYLVRVCRNGEARRQQGRWFPHGRLRQLPLTGLTRKILRQAGII